MLNYATLTQVSLVDDPPTLAILPLAAMETHGPHLPLGTDAMIIEGLLARAMALQQADAPRIGAARLPTLWLGASDEHADRPGTLSQPAEALIHSICAIGAGLARAGIRRVLLLHGHGGNLAAGQIAALRLRTDHGVLAATAHWLDLGLPEDLPLPLRPGADIHGGFLETSLMKAMHPDQVRLPLPPARHGVAPSPLLKPEGRIAWGWRTTDLAPDGYIGAADAATRRAGEVLADHLAHRLLELVQALAATPWPVSPPRP